MASDRAKTIFRHLIGNKNIMRHVCSKKEFLYTLDNAMMTWDQRSFYEENGYLVVPRLIESVLLEECRQRFLDLCEGRVNKGQMTLMKDVSLKDSNMTGELLYNKLQDMVWDDVLSKYVLHEQLLDYVQCFTGPNIMAMHSMLINKPPDSGQMTSIHPLHQDLHYFAFRPADHIVASWTAIDRATKVNGCLQVIPGSHKGVLLRHDYHKNEKDVNKAFHGIQGFDDHPKIMLEMEPGDTVFFHPILIHGSGMNKSKIYRLLAHATVTAGVMKMPSKVRGKPLTQMCLIDEKGCRKAISCHYADSACEYINVKGTTQENIAKEVQDIAKRRGFKMDFKEFWEVRSRLARGQRLNL